MNQHSVYVAYERTADGDSVLYVGRTSRGERRLRQHGKEREWWPRVHHITVDHYSTIEEAALREYELIRLCVPEFNIEVPAALTWPAHWSDDMRAAFQRRNPLVRLTG